MKDNNTLQEKLVDIQKTLSVPKKNRNNFGNYNYRSYEDILESVKPLLDGCTLIVSDEIVHFKSDLQPISIEVADNKGGKHIEIVGGDRFYIKATATISDGDKSISVSAFAREAESKKGMDEAQITGSASSYARKYALNGLFAIDDTKDADSMDNHHEQPKPSVKQEEDGYVHEPYHGEAAAKPAPTSHFCEIHGKPMKERTGKNGGTWYDHRWQENGEWQQCNGTPKNEEDLVDSWENQ
jgi:hypothetical protein